MAIEIKSGDPGRGVAYVDLSDPRDVEGVIAEIRAARAKWLRDEEEGIRRAAADETERWPSAETPRADLDEAIERRHVGADFAAEWAALDPAADQVQANDEVDDA